MDINKICNDIIDLGADKAASIDVKDIVFNADFRKSCKENKCGNYGRNYTCPPYAGTAEELIAIDALIALASKRMDEKTLLELTEDIDKKIRDRNRLRKKLRRQERRAARKNGKSSKK